MKDTILKTATPESVGIPSNVIADYISYLLERGVNLHSILIMRGGKICAEAYSEPYSEETVQRIYSCSKSVTSIAVGLLIGEGKINLNDRISDYFPENLPENLHEWVKDIRIKDTLMMSNAFTCTHHNPAAMPWVKQFFHSEPTHPPRTQFIYDTAGSHVLCALVEKLTGMTMLEYLRSKLSPLGLSEDAWCIKGTDGYSWGGSGVIMTLRDMTKLLMLVKDGGSFGGVQLLPKDYAKEAIEYQNFNDPETKGLRWDVGYGYQIWRMQQGGFAFRGMGSQHAVCFPEKDLIVCCTSDNQGTEIWDRLFFEGIYEKLLPALTQPLEEDEKAYENLKKVSAALKMPVVSGACESSLTDDINGVVYELKANPMEISQLSFDFTKDGGVLHYVTPRGEKEIPFGYGKPVSYSFPETHYYGEQIGVPSGKGYPAHTSGAWKNDKTLVLRTHTSGIHLGNITMTFGFDEDKIGIKMHKTAEWFFEEYTGLAGGKKRGGQL